MNKREFLNYVITEATEENKSVDNWVTNGKWMFNTAEFLQHWLSKDVELERNGRSDKDMACDLANELRKMKERNLVKIFLANYWLETGNIPKNIGTPLMGWFDIETKVDDVLKAMENEVQNA